MPTGKRPQKTKQQPKIDPGIFNRQIARAHD